ncbi:MAG: hypothetical protein U0M51_04390 [Eggerthellaceae bacterium]
MIEIVLTICITVVLCTGLVSFAAVWVAKIRAGVRPPSLMEMLGATRTGGDDR